MKNYWHCVLEVEIPDGEMPKGADWPMRCAIETATHNLHPQAEILNLSSGWGLNETGKEENTISKEDATNQVITNIKWYGED